VLELLNEAFFRGTRVGAREDSSDARLQGRMKNPSVFKAKALALRNHGRGSGEKGYMTRGKTGQ